MEAPVPVPVSVAAVKITAMSAFFCIYSVLITVNKDPRMVFCVIITASVSPIGSEASTLAAHRGVGIMVAEAHPMDDGEELEPMRAEVFEIAASAVSFHGSSEGTPPVVKAARAVMVEGKKTGEAAQEFGLPSERVSEAVGRIRERWDAICADKGWVTESLSLPPDIMELVKQIEKNNMEPLREALQAKLNKKLGRNTSKDEV